ncbi:uracil-DNA glycosylase, mitochondrial-like isoform X2 [Silene latifolia]|uniref:uracil-DNA glycosylase, mitochondrial-like isoform X2 n=1 Tax=Silene latifolia TaxID=37657 RepID=UPI003D7792CF
MMKSFLITTLKTQLLTTKPVPLTLSRHNIHTTMPCSSSKTLIDFFPKSNPNKRLKTTVTTAAAADGLTPEQRMRMELNKSIALSKNNLRICSDKIRNSKVEGDNSYVKLEELLVEESWLTTLSGEFQKPYATSLCKFVETEICCGKVPIYPPQHLIFNALNSTPFDKLKAVILGQDPYHGPGQAMGLSFSVPEGIKIPSSLGNILKELKQDLGCSIPSHGNLERWAVQILFLFIWQASQAPAIACLWLIVLVYLFFSFSVKVVRCEVLAMIICLKA